MSCKHKLSWYELIPLFSFVGLKGRCKMCKTRISLVYPAVELTTGFVFVILLLKFQDLFLTNLSTFIITYIYYVIAFSILIIVGVYDLKHKIIPDILSLLLAILAFIGLFVFNVDVLSIHMPNLWAFLAGPVMALPFAFFWFISGGRWMGLGDAKLMVGLGWLFGFSRALSGVVIAFWSGAVFGILLIALSKKYKMKSEIPFAPFLILGAILAFFFNLQIFPVF